MAVGGFRDADRTIELLGHHFRQPLEFPEVPISMRAERINAGLSEIEEKGFQKRVLEGVGDILVLDRIHGLDAGIGPRAERHGRHEKQQSFVPEFLLLHRPLLALHPTWSEEGALRDNL